ncbi:uncharacterized protein HD556DRAFT_1440763 [Suillus plorans]|uniref:Uncharacterized protein n=1 Tax=Suillus plorans TaxID=116603 RepID=A0A9P7DLI4_9AGAM|nr:uncharacterized protein HD556DRAFT_1440763 [Suillus plorans]KAG1797802.1 hypothetical protein HD556DRAFT_1440763 [Suillus plorans]
MHIAINQAQIQVDGAYLKLQNAEAMASHLEIQLGIDKQWEIGSEPYSQFRQEASLLTYRTALDDLERLVVMHLFELLKLSLSGTGYKLHQQISKALQRRLEAIQTALNRYNMQAAALSHSDIHTLDWTKPAHREAMVKYFKLKCAQEEIQHLNVEICRVRTAIRDKEFTVNAAIDSLLISNEPVRLELQRQWCRHAAVNAVHLCRLDRIMSQESFSGKRDLGTRLKDMSSCEIPEIICTADHQEQFEQRMTALTMLRSDEQSGGDILEHEKQGQDIYDDP